jgi:hypothetical protein
VTGLAGFAFGVPGGAKTLLKEQGLMVKKRQFV